MPAKITTVHLSLYLSPHEVMTFDQQQNSKLMLYYLVYTKVYKPVFISLRREFIIHTVKYSTVKCVSTRLLNFYIQNKAFLSAFNEL